jgi:hypothetical protein
VVVVHSCSHFFRDHFELEFYVGKLAKNGVKLSRSPRKGVDRFSTRVRPVVDQPSIWILCLEIGDMRRDHVRKPLQLLSTERLDEVRHRGARSAQVQSCIGGRVRLP